MGINYEIYSRVLELVLNTNKECMEYASEVNDILPDDFPLKNRILTEILVDNISDSGGLSSFITNKINDFSNLSGCEYPKVVESQLEVVRAYQEAYKLLIGDFYSVACDLLPGNS